MNIDAITNTLTAHSSTPQASSLGGGSTQVVGEIPDGLTFSQVLEAANSRTDLQAGRAPPETAGAGQLIPFSQIVDQVSEAHSQIDELIQRGMSNRNLSQSQLLSMQAMVYRYSQQVDIASKLIDGVTNSVKQIMSIQV